MGMRQQRCPKCGKLRPFNEGGSPKDSRRREYRWGKIDDVLVCYHCAWGIDYFPPKGRSAELAPEMITETCSTCAGVGSYEAQLPKPIVRKCAQCHGTGRVVRLRKDIEMSEWGD
jgi:hypothetical protein